VKNRLGWVVGGLAVAGAYAWGRLRQPYAEPPRAPAPFEPVPTPAAEPVADVEPADEAADETPDDGPDPRADELRRRLEEARELTDEREAFEEGETTVDQVAAVEESEAPDDRRRSVHEQARAAADEMRGGPPAG
jgi:hypothetical protein